MKPKEVVESIYKYKKGTKDLKPKYEKQRDELKNRGMNVTEADTYLLWKYGNVLRIEQNELDNQLKAKVHFQTYLSSKTPTFEFDGTTYQVTDAQFDELSENYTAKELKNSRLIINIQKQKENGLIENIFILNNMYFNNNRIAHHYDVNDEDNILLRYMDKNYADTEYQSINSADFLDIDLKEYHITTVQEYEHIFLEDIKRQIKYIHDHLNQTFGENSEFKKHYIL